MKKIIILAFMVFSSIMSYTQTEIPLAGFQAQIDEFPTVSGDTITGTFVITDYSNQWSGMDLSDSLNLVVWKNCNRYEVVEIVSLFANEVTLKMLQDGNDNLVTGVCALLEENSSGVSHLISGITDSDKQCIDSYYRTKASLVDSLVYLQGDLYLFENGNIESVDLSSLFQNYAWSWTPDVDGKLRITQNGMDGSSSLIEIPLKPRRTTIAPISSGLYVVSQPNGEAWEIDDTYALSQIDIRNRLSASEINDSTIRIYISHSNGFFLSPPHDSIDIVIPVSSSALFIEGTSPNQAVYTGDTGDNAEVGINTNDPEYSLDIQSVNNSPVRISTGLLSGDADIMYENSNTGDTWTSGITHAVYNHFRIQGDGSGSGIVLSYDNELGVGGNPITGRKLHINGDFGVGVGARFYFGTTTTQSRLVAPSSTSFAVENGSIELARFTRQGSSSAYMAIPQYSVHGTADGKPAYGFAQEEGLGLYRYNTASVGLTAGGIGQFRVNTTDAYFTQYDEARDDGIGVNFLYTDNGVLQSGQLTDLFTQYGLSYTAGYKIGITGGVIDNLAPSPFAFGSGNKTFTNYYHIGIGNSDPLADLHVTGEVIIDGIRFTVETDTLEVSAVFLDDDGNVGDETKIMGFDANGKPKVKDSESTIAFGGLESSFQTISSTSSTKVNFSTLWGSEINTDVSTVNERITVDDGGMYTILIRGHIINYNLDETLQLEIWVSGTQVETHEFKAIDTNFDINFIDDIELLSSNYVEIRLDSVTDADYDYNDIKLTLKRVY